MDPIDPQGESKCDALMNEYIANLPTWSKNAPCAPYLEAGRAAWALEYPLAAKLLDALVAEDPQRNIVISPHAIALALAFLAVGTTGAARAEILNALGEADAGGLIDLLIRVEGEMRCKLNGARFVPEVSYASGVSVWFPRGFYVERLFDAAVSRTLASELAFADPFHSPAQRQAAFRTWATRAGSAEIPTMLQARDLDSEILLAAGLRYSAILDLPARGQTRFQAWSGATQYKPTFSSYCCQHYVDRPDCRSFPFAGRRFAMWIVQPKRKPPAFRISDTRECLDVNAHAGAEGRFPSFSIRTTLDIGGALKSLGIRRALTEPDALHCLLERDSSHAARPSASTRILHAASVNLTGHRVNDPVPHKKHLRRCHLAMGQGISPCLTQMPVDGPFFFFIIEGITGALMYAGWVASLP